MIPALIALPAAHPAASPRPVVTARTTSPQPAPPGRRRHVVTAVAAGAVALLLGAGVLALAPTGGAGAPPAVRQAPPASAEYLAGTVTTHP